MITKERFYSQRRQFVDEVLFSQQLTPVEKIVAIAIVMLFVHKQSAARGAASTFADLLTIAQAIGVQQIKHPVVIAAVKKLEAEKLFAALIAKARLRSSSLSSVGTW